MTGGPAVPQYDLTFFGREEGGEAGEWYPNALGFFFFFLFVMWDQVSLLEFGIPFCSIAVKTEGQEHKQMTKEVYLKPA